MTPLSISKAWDEGMRFAGRELRLLFPIAFLLLALPGLLVSTFVPQPDTAEFYDFTRWVQRNGLGVLLLVSVGLGLGLLIIQTLGNLVITYLALRPGRSVGEGFGAAARRLPATVGAILLIAIPIGAVAFLLFVGVAGNSATPSLAEVGAAILIGFLVLLLVLAISAKLLPVLSVGAAEPVGPIGILRRSWALTSGHFWKLFGTLLLIGIVYLIISMILGIVFGLVVMVLVGNPIFNQTAAFVLQLLSSLVTSIFSVFLLAFFARIYAQLSGRVHELGRVFE